jgi:hypothetical protein
MVATDVVSDVLGAADPLTSRIATDRLTRLQSTTGTEFSAEAAAVRAESGAVAQAKTFGPLPPGDAPAIMRPVTSGDVAGTTYSKFEAFILQTFMESMLPKDDKIFGKGTAGNVWRSMLAEQLGAQLAKSGGIGIAHMLAKSHPPDELSPQTTNEGSDRGVV